MTDAQAVGRLREALIRFVRRFDKVSAVGNSGLHADVQFARAALSSIHVSEPSGEGEGQGLSALCDALVAAQRADQTIVAYFHPDCSWDVFNAHTSAELLTRLTSTVEVKGAPLPHSMVAIWSGEYQSYWRRGRDGQGNGYTSDIRRAGRWARFDAELMTQHCGPEKMIVLHDRPGEGVA